MNLIHVTTHRCCKEFKDAVESKELRLETGWWHHYTINSAIGNVITKCPFCGKTIGEK